MMLVHGCAQVGKVECRDEQMVHIATLYNEGVLPTQITSYQIESLKAGTRIASISIFLAPWGRYGARVAAGITEADGRRVQRSLSRERGLLNSRSLPNRILLQPRKDYARLVWTATFQPVRTRMAEQQTETHESR